MSSLPGALVLLGHPVAHSLSPAFQNAALRSAGLPITYELRDVAARSLGSELERLRALRAAGNVTIPHKLAVAGACDTLTPVAQRANAVNTFRFDELGKLHGHNTDVGGVDIALRTLVGDPSGAQIGVIGAGGAASAVLTAAEHWDCWVTVWARNSEQSETLAARYDTFAKRASGLREAIETMDIVINATPVGLHDDAMPFDPRMLYRGAVVLDLIVKRGETALVREVRARDQGASDGRLMLREQGALAFKWWFDLEPDRGAMSVALNEALLPR